MIELLGSVLLIAILYAFVVTTIRAYACHKADKVLAKIKNFASLLSCEGKPNTKEVQKILARFS